MTKNEYFEKLRKLVNELYYQIIDDLEYKKELTKIQLQILNETEIENAGKIELVTFIKTIK